MLNQQNGSLSQGNAETDASTTRLMDIIQDEKEEQTESDSNKKELQTEGSKEQKDILIESKLNQNEETNKEKEKQRIENEDGLRVSDVPSILLSTCEFRQDRDLLQERYLIILT